MDKTIKTTMKLGIGTMMGGMVLGSMSNLPGMPESAKSASDISISAMNLANVGNLANVATNILSKKKI